jgi:hypothetical protein
VRLDVSKPIRPSRREPQLYPQLGAAGQAPVPARGRPYSHTRVVELARRAEAGQRVEVHGPQEAAPAAQQEPRAAVIPMSELALLFDRLADAEHRAARAKAELNFLKAKIAEGERAMAAAVEQPSGRSRRRRPVAADGTENPSLRSSRRGDLDHPGIVCPGGVKEVGMKHAAVLVVIVLGLTSCTETPSPDPPLPEEAPREEVQSDSELTEEQEAVATWQECFLTVYERTAAESFSGAGSIGRASDGCLHLLPAHIADPSTEAKQCILAAAGLIERPRHACPPQDV